MLIRRDRRIEPLSLWGLCVRLICGRRRLIKIIGHNAACGEGKSFLFELYNPFYKRDCRENGVNAAVKGYSDLRNHTSSRDRSSVMTKVRLLTRNGDSLRDTELNVTSPCITYSGLLKESTCTSLNLQTLINAVAWFCPCENASHRRCHPSASSHYAFAQLNAAFQT